MPKEKAVRRVQVPLQREDDDVLRSLARHGLDDGQLIRVFWRIGLRHRDEFFADGSAASAPPEPTAAPGSAGVEPPTELAARRRARKN